MKNIFTWVVVAVLATISMSVGAQTNLIEKYHALGNTGANTEPNKWGWGCVPDVAPWGVAGGSGVRFQDWTDATSTYFNPDGTKYVGRTSIARWDGTQYTGAIYTIGTDNGDATSSQQPVSLEACKSYTLSGMACVNAAGTTNSFEFSLYNVDTKTTVKKTTWTPDATKHKFKNFTLTYDNVNTGNYLIQIKNPTGASVVMFFADGMKLVETPFTTAKDIVVSKGFFFFDKSTNLATQTFTVTGLNTEGDITISLPAADKGITLTPTVIPSGCGVQTTVTATFDNSSSTYTPYKMTFKDGAATPFQKQIYFEAAYDNLIASWDGDGLKGAGSEPNKFGWEVTGGTTTWGEAASEYIKSDNGTAYLDDLQGYNFTTTSGYDYNSRVLVLRFDKITNANKYRLPVTLEAGKTYFIKAKAAKYDFGTPKVTVELVGEDGVTLYGSGTISTTSTSGQIIKMSSDLPVTITKTGTYYLTISSTTNDKVVLADLAISANEFVGKYTTNPNQFAHYLSWTAETTPTGTTIAYIPEGFNVICTGTSNALQTTVEPGATLTVNTGVTFNSATLNLLSDADKGNATFINNGTLNNTTSNVQQYLTANRNWYLSSPVNGATDAAFGAASVSYWNEAGQAWVDNYTGTLEAGKGYVALNPTADGVRTLTGALNNSDLSVPVTFTSGTYQGFNLVGNPFSAYLNWELAYNDAATSNVLPVIWLRTKNTSGYEFQTYSATSGLSVPANVKGYIAPMQGFWVRAYDAAGTLALKKSMLSHNDGTMGMLKVKQADSENQILRLQVANGEYKDETLLFFNPNATDAYDAYDAPKMLNNSTTVPDIYTLLNNEPMVMNGMKTIPFDTEIPLVFAVKEAAQFTISNAELSNFPVSTTVLLTDKTTGVKTDLTLSNYTFNADAGTVANRFVLTFPSRVPTGANALNVASFYVLGSKNGFTLRAEKETNENAKVYNQVGQLLTSKTVTGTEAFISGSFNPGVYFVKINNQTVKVVVK